MFDDFDLPTYVGLPTFKKLPWVPTRVELRARNVGRRDRRCAVRRRRQPPARRPVRTARDPRGAVHVGLDPLAPAGNRAVRGARRRRRRRREHRPGLDRPRPRAHLPQGPRGRGDRAPSRSCSAATTRSPGRRPPRWPRSAGRAASGSSTSTPTPTPPTRTGACSPGHGTPMRRLIESGAVQGRNFVQVGLRGYWPPVETFAWMREQGLRWHLMREIEERGAEAVIDDAIAEALDGPDAVYLSVDIDVIDPGLAPGHRHAGTGRPAAARGAAGGPPDRRRRGDRGHGHRRGLAAVRPRRDDRDGRQPGRPRGDLRARGEAARPVSAVRFERRRRRGRVAVTGETGGCRRGARAPVRPRPGRRPGRPRPVPGARRADGRARPRARGGHRPARGPARRGRPRGHRASTSIRRCSTAPARRRRRPPAPDGRAPAPARRGRRPDGRGCPTAGDVPAGIHRRSTRSSCWAPARTRRRAVATLAAHLAPGGLAVVDAWLPDADDLARYDGRARPRVGSRGPGDRATRDEDRQRRSTTRRPGASRLTTIFERGRPGMPRPCAGCARTGCASSAPDELVAFAPRRRGWRSRRWPATTSSAPGPGAERVWSPGGQRPRRARSLADGRRRERPTARWDRGTAAATAAWYSRPDAVRPDPPARRRGRPPGRAVHPRPAELAVRDQAARRRVATARGCSAWSASSGPTSSSSTRCSRAGSRACSSSSSSTKSGSRVPVIVLTVPQQPVAVDPAQRDPRRALDAVLRLRPGDPAPAGPPGRSSRRRRRPARVVISLFAPKGGVGKTTLAFNLAVARRPARAADRAHRRQPPVRRPAGAAQGARRRAVDPGPARPTGSRSPTSRTSCGATRRVSTSCSRRRAWRWPRWSPSATSRRSCRCCGACTRSWSSTRRPSVNDVNLAFLDAVRHDRRDRDLRLDHDPQHARRWPTRSG